MAVIEAIATQYLEAAAASVTFDDIPSTYEHLQLRMSTRATQATNNQESIFLQLGDSGDSPVDTGSNYSMHYMKGQASTAGAGAQTGQASIWLGKHPAGGAPAAWYSGITVDVLDYANTNKNTTIQSTGNQLTTGSSPRVRFTSGLWDSTTAVNAILVMGDTGLRRGCEFTLYGLND